MLAPVQYLLGDRRAFLGQPFQFAGIGGPGAGLAAFLAALVTHLVEKDFAQLLGAADGERPAGQFVDLKFQPADLNFIQRGQPRQFGPVHLDAGHFHLRDHRQQRAIDLFMDGRHLLLPQPAAEALPQPEGNIGILGGIVGRLAQIDFGKAFQPLGDILVGNRRVTKMAGGQIVHAMVPTPGIERVGQQHGVIIGAEHRHAVASQDDQIIFQILTDLQHSRITKQRVQTGNGLGQAQLRRPFGEHAVASAVRYRDVARLAWRNA